MAEIDAQAKKLILLYMLRQVPGIAINEWMNWAIESLYLDYFSFAQAKDELKRERLIAEVQKKGEMRLDASGRPVVCCSLSPEGELVLNQLLPGLSQPIRAFLHEEGIRKKQIEERENSVSADVILDENGKFYAKLVLSDAYCDIIRLQVLAIDEANAKKICDNWKKNPAAAYKKILYALSLED